jgi:hypothetical protein
VDIKRIDAERELEMMEIEMGLREPESIEAAPEEPAEFAEQPEPSSERPDEGRPAWVAWRSDAGAVRA